MGTFKTQSLVLCLTLAFFSAIDSSASTGAPTPPSQPTSGPGGTDYNHGAVIEHSYDVGDKQYWLFEPNNPKPESAPVVVFNHGWGGMTPDAYRAWINHLVRRGNIVIYPRYQASFCSPTYSVTPNSIAAIRAAFFRLQTEPGHTRPLLDKVAAVGHSAGGQITANFAANARREGLPQPKAIMCAEPGKSYGRLTRVGIQLYDLSAIPSDTLLLTVVRDADKIVRDVDAKRIFRESTNVPLANKNYVVLVSDDHGVPKLRADHFAPTALHTVDALDFYGTWKLFDALCDAAFYNRNRDIALGATPQQKLMGYWSDGTPVKPMIVTDQP